MQAIAQRACILLAGLSLSAMMAPPFGCARAESLSKAPSLSVESRREHADRLIEIYYQGLEPGMLLLVGLSGPTPLAAEEDPSDEPTPWSDAALAFVCRIESAGSSKLVINEAAIREALGDDVRVIVEVVRAANVIVHSDRRVKGGGGGKVMSLDPAALRADFQSIHRSSDLPAGVGEVGMVPEHGYMRVTIHKDDSVMRREEILRP